MRVRATQAENDSNRGSEYEKQEDGQKGATRRLRQIAMMSSGLEQAMAGGVDRRYTVNMPKRLSTRGRKLRQWLGKAAQANHKIPENRAYLPSLRGVESLSYRSACRRLLWSF
jgi:hypothetical protein